MKNNISKAQKKNFCTSCQICSVVCPAEAIEIKLNNDGFYQPIVNNNKCINCGKCVSICYKYDLSVELNDEYKIAYAAKSKDKLLLSKSTSGGIAHLLAEHLIKKGYKICGVTYNYTLNRAEAVIVDKIEELEKIQGSKYIQSYSEEIYKKIFQDLNSEKYAIFGLPCQIYGIDTYLRKINRRNNVILIDLFCHGCPSLKFWRKYLNYVVNKNKLDGIKKIEFRSKKKGWHEFIISILDNKDKLFISKNENDIFFRLFFSNKILNESCYKCKLRSTLKYTDIRLGDYWGSEYDLDKEGVSAVVLVTEKGESIFKNIKSNIEFRKTILKNIVKAQSYGKNYRFEEKNRKYILSILNENDKFEIFLKKYNQSLNKKEKIKYFLKNIFLMLPQNIRYKIKKYYHNS